MNKVLIFDMDGVIGIATTHPAEELGDTDMVIEDFRELKLEMFTSL